MVGGLGSCTACCSPIMMLVMCSCCWSQPDSVPEILLTGQLLPFEKCFGNVFLSFVSGFSFSIGLAKLAETVEIPPAWQK